MYRIIYFDRKYYFTAGEFENLRSQIGTTSWGGARYLPYAFTEHGVLMLSGVLNSAIAIQVNIQIIKVFIKLREALLNHHEVLLKLEQLDKKIIQMGFDVKMHDNEIESIFQLIDELCKEKDNVKHLNAKQPIGFKTGAQKK